MVLKEFLGDRVEPRAGVFVNVPDSGTCNGLLISDGWMLT